MSEFFKAATRCDASAADKAPMYVDRTAMMEEQYRTQRLVEQTMRTELLLRELEAEHQNAAAATTSPRENAPQYHAPPQCTGHLPPDQRCVGSRHIEKTMQERANLWRQKLQDNRSEMNTVESREALAESRQHERRQKEADRELNAIIVSRQIAARESELDRTRAIEESEGKKRRVHPIDVLHQRIAEELARDVSDASTALADQLLLDAEPIERTYEDEQLKAIREFRRGPILHIPSATNVAR